MFRISFQADLEGYKRQLADQQQKLLRAARRALNDSAEAARDAVRRTEAQVFDRPTPYTLNSTLIRYASYARMQADVYINDWAPKSTAPVKWLAPQVYGGGRDLKRFELALQHAGYLASGEQVVPGPGAQLDSYGNINRGQLVQILAWFQAFQESGFAANMTADRRKRLSRRLARKRGAQSVEYFFLRDRHGKLRRGIYQRTTFHGGSAVRPVLFFTRPGLYRRRFDFFGIVERAARDRFGPAFEERMREQA